MPTLTLTDEHRQKIRAAYLAGCASKEKSMCCGPRQICVDIVGEEFADDLKDFAYEGLCCGEEPRSELIRNLYLKKIADLATLESPPTMETYEGN